jgi:hypothetical protein
LKFNDRLYRSLLAPSEAEPDIASRQPAGRTNVLKHSFRQMVDRPRNGSMTHVQGILREFGQTLLPIQAAPRDGRIVMCYSQHYGLVAVHWVTEPFPEWRTGEELGFLDQAFVGWYDHTKFRPVGETELTRLLVAYIDDMREEKRHDVLKLLETPLTSEVSNDHPQTIQGSV